MVVCFASCVIDKPTRITLEFLWLIGCVFIRNADRTDQKYTFSRKSQTHSIKHPLGGCKWKSARTLLIIRISVLCTSSNFSNGETEKMARFTLQNTSVMDESICGSMFKHSSEKFVWTFGLVAFRFAYLHFDYVIGQRALLISKHICLIEQYASISVSCFISRDGKGRFNWSTSLKLTSRIKSFVIAGNGDLSTLQKWRESCHELF